MHLLDEHVLLFAKNPANEKNRLTQYIEDKKAADFYRLCIEQTVNFLTGNNLDFSIHYQPKESRKDFMQWLGKHHSYIPQNGRDDNHKLKNAFALTFSVGCQKVLALGSKTPDLPFEYIRQAFEALNSSDVVIGPSESGSCCLIGTSSQEFTPGIFKQISWDKPEACRHLKNLLTENSLSYHILPAWPVIETIDSLHKFYEKNRTTDLKNTDLYRIAEQILISLKQHT